MLWVSGESVNINPDAGVFLGCGNGTTVHPESRIGDLEANILIVWDHERVSKVAIISVDTLFLGSKFTDAVERGLSGEFEKSEIFLAATHTHSAPMIDETKPLLGKRNDDYADILARRIVDTAKRLVVTEPSSVKLSSYKVNLGGVVSRRNTRFFSLSRYGIRFWKTLARPDLRRRRRGTEATFVEFRNSREIPLATLAVIPCHPVALMGTGVISPDYVGLIRKGFRQALQADQGTPFVFLQGASGDLNPWWRPKWFGGGALALLDQIVNGAQFIHPYFSREQLLKWGDLRVREILTARARFDRDSQVSTNDATEVSSSIDLFPLSRFIATGENQKERVVSIQRLNVGHVAFLGVSAELTSSLRHDLSSVLAGAELVGCIRDTFGYIASAGQCIQGGYEADGYQDAFSVRHLEGNPPVQALSQALGEMGIAQK